MALDPTVVRKSLRAASLKFRWLSSARWVAAGTACSILGLLLFLLADVMFHFGSTGRWAGFLLVLLPLLAGAALARPPLIRRISDEAMARRIERSCAGARNVLINAVQFDRDLAPGSPMRSTLYREMDDPFPRVNWSEVFDLRLRWKIFFSFAATATLLSGWGLLKPAYFTNSLARVLLPSRNIAPLTRTSILDLQPGDLDVPNGGTITLSAKLAGEIPKVARVHFRPKGGTWQEVLLDHDLGTAGFTHVWKDVRQPFEYFVRAGDAESETFHVAVRPKTVIRARTLEIIPPAYTKLPKAVGKQFATVRNVVPGSKLHFTIEFNNPVREFTTKLGGRDGGPGVAKDPSVWEYTAAVSSPSEIKLSYVDKYGIADSETIPVEVKADQPPKITVSNPAEGSQVLASADGSVPLQFSANDDFGLGSLALYQSTPEKPDAKLVREWKEAAGQKSFGGETTIRPSEFARGEHKEITFCLVAKDLNEVTGPGVTVSRPIVIQLEPADALAKKEDQARDQTRRGIAELIRLQETNLGETREAISSRAEPSKAFPPLTKRQASIVELGETILSSGDSITPEMSSNLRGLLDKEMKEAVIALRNAGAVPADQALLTAARAVALEASILARLQGTSAAVDDKARQDTVGGLLGVVENLLRKERDLTKETGAAATAARKELVERQDTLGDVSRGVVRQLEQGAENPSAGDDGFRARLKESAAQMKTLRIYEEMLSASEKISEGKITEATTLQGGVIRNLESILATLNKWRFADATQKASDMKKAASDLKERLDALGVIQKEILEKSKELSRKSDFKPEDYAVMKEIAKSKELMAAAIEQMLKDGHIFPDVKQGNEMQTEITKIFEDVIQEDKKAVEEGTVKPGELAVQKEDAILKGIERAKKINQDMEIWLNNTSDNLKWLLENFDKTEMPDMPMLKLPEQTEDLIGDLLKEQKGLADQVENSAANQLAASNEGNGGSVTDGNQDSFGSQGKSGNQRPKNNEQAGRSSGGREGMSDGEMSGKVADNLDGSKAKARRTRDAMQHGQVEDNGPVGSNLATGGGKSGGYSLQDGMDGDAPVKVVKGAGMAAASAAAAKQAILAEKTSKQVARASLLFVKSSQMSDVPRLMEESTMALKEGQLQQFTRLHGQIVARLQAAKGGGVGGGAVVMKGGGVAPLSSQTPGGDEGEAPAAYRKQVADYYRSLNAP